MADAFGRVEGLPLDERPTIVTVGTFDGVHLGHWGVLQEIRARAEARDGRSVLVTFHPHPLRVVRPSVAPQLLTTPDEKKEILAESGVDYAVFVAFTPELRDYSPDRFVKDILVRGLGMSELVIGYDHGFGRGRSGDVETLKVIADRQGFVLDVVEAVQVGGEAISSSNIRQALLDGRLADATRALGRYYSLRGVVVKGDGRGRSLGFPTANVQIGSPDKLVPPPGIYAAFATLGTGTHMGALHIGPRPTFPGSASTIEIFLLDFDRDVYGERVRLDVVKLLRPVVAFGGVDDLVAQMHRDVREARRALGGDSGSRSEVPA